MHSYISIAAYAHPYTCSSELKVSMRAVSVAVASSKKLPLYRMTRSLCTSLWLSLLAKTAGKPGWNPGMALGWNPYGVPVYGAMSSEEEVL